MRIDAGAPPLTRQVPRNSEQKGAAVGTFRQAHACCVCGVTKHQYCYKFEPTKLPGSGWRCANRKACQGRVRAIVQAQQQHNPCSAADALCVPATAEALAAELRSRGWAASTTTFNTGQWGEYPVCEIETDGHGQRIEMPVVFDRFDHVTWFDYSEQNRCVTIWVSSEDLADLVITSVGDGYVHAPDGDDD